MSAPPSPFPTRSSLPNYSITAHTATRLKAGFDSRQERREGGGKKTPPPSHSAKNIGGRLQSDTHTPFIQGSRDGLTRLSGCSLGILQGNELTHNSPGNACAQSPQLSEPLWTDPWPERVELIRAS